MIKWDNHQCQVSVQTHWGVGLVTVHLDWRKGEIVCTYEIKYEVGVSRDVKRCAFIISVFFFLHAGPGLHSMKPRELNNFFQGSHAFLNRDRLLE